ncbi:uncharacterized protein LOC127010105 [Eriocheir sinensis]|uniref:uncharacterized protein LOC127010105 n=1 Tax=Eriocheir sinensis TaxID=95602 RepID=UPI0021C969CA|nr:uncharacterized protein LOC127010105 [Eriocheir sinensis]
MLRGPRPNTYKAHMSPVDSEFFDFPGEADEAAAALLARHLLNLLERARRTKLRVLANNNKNNDDDNSNNNKNNNNNRSARRNSLAPCKIKIQEKARTGTPSQWLHKLLPGSDTVHVLLPEDFITRVVRDALRMTEGEEKGIRACTLCLELWDGDKRLVLGRIVCDPRVETSYTLYVRLVKATPPLEATTFRFFNTSTYDPIYISPGYQLEKKKKKMMA